MGELDLYALEVQLEDLAKLLTDAADRGWEGVNADALAAARRIHDRAAADLATLMRDMKTAARLRRMAPALKGLPDDLADAALEAGPWAEPLATAAQQVVRSGAMGEAQHQTTLIAARALLKASAIRAAAERDLTASRRIDQEAEHLEQSLPRRRDEALAAHRSWSADLERTRQVHEEMAAALQDSLARLANARTRESDYYRLLVTVLRIWIDRQGEAPVRRVVDELIAAGAPYRLGEQLFPRTPEPEYYPGPDYREDPS